MTQSQRRGHILGDVKLPGLHPPLPFKLFKGALHCKSSIRAWQGLPPERSELVPREPGFEYSDCSDPWNLKVLLQDPNHSRIYPARQSLLKELADSDTRIDPFPSTSTTRALVDRSPMTH